MPFDALPAKVNQDLECLMRAREGVARAGGWTRQQMNGHGNSHCAFGWLVAITSLRTATRITSRYLYPALKPRYRLVPTFSKVAAVMTYNDAHTQVEVVALFDAAISLAVNGE